MPHSPISHATDVAPHDNNDDDWDLEDWVGILMILGMCIGILIGIYT